MIELIIGLVAFYAGWKLREEYAKILVARFQKTMETAAKDVERRVVEILVERNESLFLVYNTKTKEFLAQGADHKAISEVLSNRFPDIIFIADVDNLEKVGYPNDTV